MPFTLSNFQISQNKKILKNGKIPKRVKDENIGEKNIGGPSIGEMSELGSEGKHLCLSFDLSEILCNPSNDSLLNSISKLHYITFPSLATFNREPVIIFSARSI